MRKSFATHWLRCHNAAYSLVHLYGSALFGCAAAASALLLTLAFVSAQETDRRRIVIISDLHMGVGRDVAGAWHATEDFRWADEFHHFLAALEEETDTGIDLILNGDTFELWQLSEPDCLYDDPSLGCTEEAALARMEYLLVAHAAEIKALADFARVGSNRVVLVPGDHDAALLFPAVRGRVEAAFGVSETRVSISTTGYWMSADGQVHVEHGHQIGARANRFSEWPRPFIERDGRRHLERPWGAQIAAAFFHEQEARYPVVDNFADKGTGVSYGLAAEGVSDLGALVSQYLRFVLFRMPWQQFRVDLDAGDVLPPSWDLDAVRDEGAPFLVDSLPDDDRFKPAAEHGLTDGHLASLVTELSDAELTAICDYRAAVRRARRRFERYVTQIDPRGPPVSECPRLAQSRGGQFDYFWRTRDLTYGGRIDAVQLGRPTRSTLRPIAIFVHGHTHLVDWRQRVLQMTRLGREVIADGFSPARDALSPVVINGGAWQRTITPVQFGRLQAVHGMSDVELLTILRPEHLAPCYSFVQVEAYAETPERPAIRYWRQAENGQWALAAACGRQPTLADR